MMEYKMKRILSIFLILVFCVVSIYAQKSKPWIEWSKKDAEKILNNSAWGQTQDDTDTSEMMYSPTADPAISKTTAARIEDKNTSAAARVESGAKNSALSLKYRVRFFSAKPVREAFARMIVLQQAGADDQKLKAFA